jgi:hypothetical protein
MHTSYGNKRSQGRTVSSCLVNQRQAGGIDRESNTFIE